MNLQEFFTKYPKVALGFSGGVDSSFLLYAAHRYGADVKAIFVKSQFQPEFELEDAKRLAEYVGVGFDVIHCDALSSEEVRKNPADRCYHCKNNIFGLIAKTAAEAGYEYIMDGTNASDEEGDRPGMRALKEMKVLSPLRMCGLTKADVRELSREAGLFTWNKPSYACLATRVPTGEEITDEKLARVEKAETELASLGFSDFRVRLYGRGARIQLPGSQMVAAVEKRKDITEKLKPLFEVIMLDMEER